MRMRNRILVAIFLIFSFVILDYLLIREMKEPVLVKKKRVNKIIHIKKKKSPVKVKKVDYVIKRGDTIEKILKRSGFNSSEISNLVDEAKKVYDLRKIKRGNKIYFIFKNGKLSSFTYYIDENYLLKVILDGGKFKVKREKIPYKILEAIIRGKIKTNLFDAIEEIGEKDPLALQIAYIFGWDIDFYTDLRRGDSFKLIVNKYFLDGKFKKYGNIKFIIFVNKGKKYEAICFKFPDGRYDYYTPDGKSLRRQFLKSPLKFGRITSRFSYHRFHPILKRYMPHLGVDIAAPVGTPVHAVGDGVVVYAGWRGGAGKFIEIRHKNRYRTQYMHLSRIKRGIRRGVKVTQGEVIGYVGMTGLATGPHLDFRIKKNGRYINPLKARFKRKIPLPEKYRSEFIELVDKYEKIVRE